MGINYVDDEYWDVLFGVDGDADEVVGEQETQVEDYEGAEAGMRKNALEHANADGSVDEKVRESVDASEDESVDAGEDGSVNERMDDVESEGADEFWMNGGKMRMLMQTQG